MGAKSLTDIQCTHTRTMDLCLIIPQDIGASHAHGSDGSGPQHTLDELQNVLETFLLVSPDLCPPGLAELRRSAVSDHPSVVQQNRSNRQELWMWLVTDAVQLPVPGSDVDRWTAAFTDLLPGQSGNTHAAAELRSPCRRMLRLLCEAQPQQVCCCTLAVAQCFLYACSWMQPLHRTCSHLDMHARHACKAGDEHPPSGAAYCQDAGGGAHL